MNDWETTGPFEFPSRITPKWIMARIDTASAEWYLALRSELRDRSWGAGKPQGNEDIEWFLLRCLPQREQRRVDAVEQGYVRLAS